MTERGGTFNSAEAQTQYLIHENERLRQELSTLKVDLAREKIQRERDFKDFKSRSDDYHNAINKLCAQRDIAQAELTKSKNSKTERTFQLASTGRFVPWSVAERIYEAYAKKYGTSQSLERLAERGGFYPEEADALYPQWREEAEEVLRLRTRVAELESRQEKIIIEKAATMGCVREACIRQILSSAGPLGPLTQSEEQAIAGIRALDLTKLMES